MSAEATQSWNVIAALDDLSAVGPAVDRADAATACLRAELAALLEAPAVGAERWLLPAAIGLRPLVAAGVLLLLI